MIGSAELQQLIDDMFETMRHVGGVGLAAPQIGIDLQLVIFGFERSERYPDAEPVPQTILLNPVITPLATEVEDGWEGCLSVPGLRAWCHVTSTSAIRASTRRATRSTALPTASMRGWCSMSATT
jgi:peptide deformylase